MKLVSSYGSIYRISIQEYMKQLGSIIRGEGYRLDPGRYLGEVECNLTDLTAEEAQVLLDELRGVKPKSKLPRSQSLQDVHTNDQ